MSNDDDDNRYEKEKITNEKYTAPASSSSWNHSSRPPPQLHPHHHNADNLPHGHSQLANWTVLALNNICQLWRARSTGCNKSKLEKDLFTNNMFSPTTSASSWRRIKNMFWSNFATASSSFVDSNSFDKIQEYPSQREFFEPNFNFPIFVTKTSLDQSLWHSWNSWY